MSSSFSRGALALIFAGAGLGCSLDKPVPPHKPASAAQPAAPAELRKEPGQLMPEVVAEVPPAPAVEEPPPKTLREALSSEEFGTLLTRIVNDPNQLNVRDEERQGLFHWLAQLDRSDLVQGLLENGLNAGVTAVDRHGRLPLHYASSRVMVQLLWNFPVTIAGGSRRGTKSVPAYAFPDNLGQLPLHVMAALGHTEAVLYSVSNICGQHSSGHNWLWGTLLDSKDRQGMTAHQLALLAQDTRSAEALNGCP